MILDDSMPLLYYHSYYPYMYEFLLLDYSWSDTTGILPLSVFIVVIGVDITHVIIDIDILAIIIIYYGIRVMSLSV